MYKNTVQFKRNYKKMEKGKAHCTARYHLRVVAVVVVLALALKVEEVDGLRSMELVYTWASPTFVLESEEQRQQMQENGTYVPGNSVPFDVAVGGPNRSVFVSIPWMVDGSPVTLATIEDPEQRSPRLVPYPDWSWHAGARGCDGLTSVFRMQVDSCGRLWVIDSGVADAAYSFRRQCPSQLLVFNLTTNELLLRHRFVTPEANCSKSLLLNVAVDQVGDTCDDVYAYLADSQGFAIYVYSLRTDSSWRVASDLFFPDVNARRFNTPGTTFDFMDGVLGLALSSPLGDEAASRLLFFHSTSSYQEGFVPTSVLRNQTLFADGFNGAPDQFRFIGTRKCQAAGEVMDRSGRLFFSPLCSNTIVCWNSSRPYNSHHQAVVEYDERLIRFVVSMKVIPNADESGDDLWAIANNGQLLFTLPYRGNFTKAINILRGDVRELVVDTIC